MTQADKPAKEKVREWLRREISERRPPPDISEIRRTLGWDIAPAPDTDKQSRRKAWQGRGTGSAFGDESLQGSSQPCCASRALYTRPVMAGRLK